MYFFYIETKYNTITVSFIHHVHQRSQEWFEFSLIELLVHKPKFDTLLFLFSFLSIAFVSVKFSPHYTTTAEIAWNQKRKEWVGDQSNKAQRPPRVSTICLTGNPNDMLFSNESFRPPIPLARRHHKDIAESERLFNMRWLKSLNDIFNYVSSTNKLDST
ncbi:uncharacterized protein [Medicago truncatula]|uniref:uncharacterized protein isoform X2 n=1 Tax=Medicago truncatula TaxID=3880 RepID=UPI000D2F3C43|nr:uncharacterized protein LOC11425781 isoform X2 [Medicago truncatula]